MAIVIEEEQNKTDIASILTWLVVLAMIVMATYYIFFKTPTLVEVIVPTNFKNIEPLAHINIDPGTVINDQGFQSLSRHNITPPEPGNAGRPNPFLAP